MNVVFSHLRLRKLTVADSPAIAHVIRQVSAEYGLTADKGHRRRSNMTSCIRLLVSLAAYWVVGTKVKWSAAVGLRH